MNIKKIINREFLKSNKKTLIVFAIGLIGIFLIFISEKPSKQKNAGSDISDNSSYSYDLEEHLSEVISHIEGAGKTKVFLTIEESEEYVYAQDRSYDSRNSSGGRENNEYVIVDSQNGKSGLLVKTVNPKIRGVAIVCDGGEDPIVQQRIYSCVSASLGISTARISISKMSTTEVKNEK